MPSGLLDVNGEPKPVYFVLDELINQQWNTQKEGKLSDQGILKFRGFFGSYEVYVDFEGQTYVANFEAPKGINNRLTVTLSQDG
jgi:hypothetical protein